MTRRRCTAPACRCGEPCDDYYYYGAEQDEQDESERAAAAAAASAGRLFSVGPSDEEFARALAELEHAVGMTSAGVAKEPV